MDKFWVVSLFHLQPSREEWSQIEDLALNSFKALGIEEFSMDEAEVDAMLGDRSYSGGDLPPEVLDEVEKSMQQRPGTYRFFFSDATNGKNFLNEVKQIALCESQMEEQQTTDWNAEWKKHYSPIEVNDRLTIVPSWQTDFKIKTQERLYINPGMGFGTGSHETTFLCLKLFTEDILGKPVEKILDFGSGSGILGLAGLKFYPDALVDFYDIDIEANKNCFHNAQINELDGQSFRLLLPEVRSELQPKYELVFANILENILVLEQKSLVEMTEKGGWLILSGLLKPQSKNIITRYSTQLKFIKEVTKGDWSALLFQKES